MTPADLIRDLERQGCSFAVVYVHEQDGTIFEDLDVSGPPDVVQRSTRLINENKTAILEIVNARSFFEELKQPEGLYDVRPYTDEQKHQMIERYIERLEKHLVRDDEPLIIEDGEISSTDQGHDESMLDKDRTVTPTPGYRTTALCFYCLEPIEAIQPGGLNPRHVHDKVPYGECRQALERKKG